MRFPEFNDEWNIFKLSDVVERVKRKNKDNECTLPLTISAQYGLIDQKEFFGKNVASSNLTNYYLLYKGDFAYNKSYSKDYAWGAIKRLNFYDKGVVSNLYICFKPTKIDSDFLECYFETDKWNKQISDIAGEGARNHGLLNMSTADFFDTKHYFPSKDEQRKISSLIDLISERINTQNKIISDLKIELEEISKKLFAMKNSEEKYLGDLCKITTGKLDANRMVPDGKYRFYTCAEHYYYIDEYAFDCEALLISGNGANVGYIHYYNGKFNAYQRTYVLSNFVDVDAHYLKSYLDVYLKRRIDSEKNTGNMPYIKLDTLSKMRIKTPTMVEQKKIAVSISNLSAKIETEQKILDLYLKQKNYLLKNLFI